MSASDDSLPTTGSSASGPAGGGSTKVGDAGLRIHWDRVGIALFGAVALAAAVVTSVLAVVGLVGSVIPVIALVLAIASIAALRTLALRDHRAAASPRSRPATNEAAGSAPSEKPVVQRPTALFNAEEDDDTAGRTAQAKDDAPAPVAAPAPFTAAELRAAALEVAAEAGDNADGAGSPWQPVDVPKPTYVEAPKAERVEPAPLDLPETPKPQTKTPIKNGAVAPKIETTSAPRMNLDDILQRRRA